MSFLYFTIQNSLFLIPLDWEYRKGSHGQETQKYVMWIILIIVG